MDGGHGPRGIRVLVGLEYRFHEERVRSTAESVERMVARVGVKN
jgi:hypothetical protein